MSLKRQFTVDLHVHTVASGHAYSTVNEYARRASEHGLEMFAISDHGPALPDSSTIWHFQNMRVLPRRLDGVILLRSIEANILENGLLDVEDHTLSFLDFAMAGLHEPACLPKGVKANTEAMVKAIESGRIQIVTHPGNPNFPVDIDAVVEAAVRHNVALEVNNSSFKVSRKGSWEPCLELIRAHGRAGGVVALGSDSHHSHTLGCFEKSLELVEAAGFPYDRIINATPETTLAFLKQHGINIEGLDIGA